MNPISIVHGFIKVALDEVGITEYSIEPNAVVRMDQCIKCPEGGKEDKDKWNKFCGSCGCFAPAKVVVKSESCPLNKW